MEENYIEQPKTESDENSFENSISDEQFSAENLEGSIYGKFKDGKSLLEAYNALQGEFTRKSQKLAEIQRKYEEFAVFENKNETLEDVLNGIDDSEKYKKEIEETLQNNEKIDGLPNKYRIAFEMTKYADDKFEKSINSQDFFDKYIANNESIKNKIVGEYLSKLNNISSAPNMLSGNSTSVSFSPLAKPKTMKEAGEIFSKMLK